MDSQLDIALQQRDAARNNSRCADTGLPAPWMASCSAHRDPLDILISKEDRSTIKNEAELVRNMLRVLSLNDFIALYVAANTI